MDRLNHARKRLLDTIDGDEAYKGRLIKKYGKIPTHVYLSGMNKWYRKDYEKALKAAQDHGIDIKA